MNQQIEIDTPPEALGFEHWALLEIMGHQRYAGLVSEETIAGGAMLRIDIPATPSTPALTKYFNTASVYCLTPVTESVARGMASQFKHQPVQPWELPEELKQPRLNGPVETVAEEPGDDFELDELDVDE